LSHSFALDHPFRRVKINIKFELPAGKTDNPEPRKTAFFSASGVLPTGKPSDSGP
jgi:hypothetical protein